MSSNNTSSFTAKLASLSPLQKSLILHISVLGIVLVLPYLHIPPKERPPQVIEAVLVSAPKAATKPIPPVQPKPEPVPEPEPEPIPQPEPPPVIEKPLPVKEPPKQELPKELPKIAVPEKKQPEKIEKKPESKPEPAPKPVETAPAKPTPIIKKPTLDTSAFDAEMRALQKQSQREALEAEMRADNEKANARAQEAASLAIRDKYQRLINQRVVTKWNRPLSAKNGMVTTLRITVLPGGEVSSVITVKSSGNPAFDASAEDAVRRASPLPVPDDPALFRQYFSIITFKFNPEDL